jgi:dephospho-CoA kinase
MLVIGITGGICSGKSTVTETVASLGAAVIDADKLGHTAYAKGSECLQKVVEAFGEQVLDEEGCVNRRALGGIVFSDPAQMQVLNGVVWPYIRAMIATQISQLKAESSDTKVIAIEAAILIEAGWMDMMDEVWVVAVDRATAIQRLMMRNNLSEQDSIARVNSQMDVEERKRYGKRVIENSGSREELVEKVKAEYQSVIGAL